MSRITITAGFTLIESLTAMAIACILAGLALPAFKQALEHQRVAAATHLLSTHFALARSTAISRGMPISVCPSSNGTHCDESSDWSTGWIIYRDPQRSEQPEEAMILEQQARPAGGSTRLLSSTGRRRIRFLPDGRSAGTNLRVRICVEDRLKAEVVVNNAGRTRSHRVPNTQPCVP